MIFQTTILPRRDGTVKFKGPNGKEFVFAENEYGDLVCDVEDEASKKTMLKNPHFIPYNDEDIEAIGELLVSGQGPASNQGGDLLDGDDDDVLEEGYIEAPPLEANTPPKSFKEPKKNKVR